MKFDRNDIMNVEIISYEGMLFEDEEDLQKYLDSCDAILDTTFYYELRDFLRYDDIEDLGAIYGITGEQFAEKVEEYTEKVDELLQKYDIEVKKRTFHIHELSGLYGDLKAFAKEYTSDIEFKEDKGMLLADVENQADIDLDSGDEDYILARIEQ